MPFKIQAPMKLEYVVALARQIIEARQIRHDKIATGRLPMVCDNGTLRFDELACKEPFLEDQNIPDKVTKSQNQDAISCELYNRTQITMKRFDEISEHWCKSKRAQALRKTQGGR